MKLPHFVIIILVVVGLVLLYKHRATILPKLGL